jgi:hypothetical protein
VPWKRLLLGRFAGAIERGDTGGVVSLPDHVGLIGLADEC